jgi:hypothetical protein
MDYQILFDADLDEYAWELESKGCLDLSIKLEALVIPVSFYDPVRLAQEVGDAVVMNGVFFERNIVVISKVNRTNIENAVKYLNISGGLRWSRLSEQLFRFDKWSVCRG